MIRYSNSEQETYAIGEDIGNHLKPGAVICLIGDLGVGKTVFTKGLAHGMGITESITSPTFNIVNTYDLQDGSFHHFDVYRIENPEELEDIGFDEYLYGTDIVLIEWANLITEYIPAHATWIYIEKDLEQSDVFRKITIDEEGVKALEREA